MPRNGNYKYMSLNAESQEAETESRDAWLNVAASEVGLFGQGWEAFEEVDRPRVECALAVPDDDPAIVNSLLTYITVTTFLAGFAVADFGSFKAEAWAAEDGSVGVRGCAFLIIMAWVSGCTMYMSIVGVVIAAVYYRARNQLAPAWDRLSWDQSCEAAMKPVIEALGTGDGLKGRRHEAFQQAFAIVLRSTPDWSHSFALGGRGLDTVLKLRLRRSENDEDVWMLFCEGPAECISKKCFHILQARSFPFTVIMYIVAQSIKALRGVDDKLVVTVVCILSLWMGRMAHTLGPMYMKLND
mmetsp:Transcript_52740/g.160316  ORF Transcript_52740/g.160316 Transcript_52740/m.160316 type:complete len:299 (-) Transcript_52740:150-1046(-)